MQKRLNHCLVTALSVLMLITETSFATIANTKHNHEKDMFVIGVASDYMTLDPHLRRYSPTFQLANYLFDTLFYLNEHGQYESNILASYTVQNKTTWLLSLKKNIFFHNGRHLNTDDIIYTLNRIKNLPSSHFDVLVERIKFFEKIDEYTLKLETHKPHPTLKRDLSLIFILQNKDHYLHHDFIQQSGTIGTGPYKFIKHHADKSLILEAHPNYHGKVAYQKHIKYRIIKNTQTRVEAFKTGKVHLIEELTPKETAILSSMPEAEFLKIPTSRLIYLAFDSYRQSSPWVTDKQGRALPDNPFKDIRVRKAFSYAINRDQLITQTLHGAGLASGQFVLPRIQGHDPSLQPDEYNPILAKALLDEAGYSKGFQLVINGPKNRYIKDVDTLKAIKKMLANVNITVTLNIKSIKDHIETLRKHDTSCFLLGISTQGDLSSILSAIIRTPNNTNGVFNLGRYSNKAVNKLIDQGSEDFNEIRRLSIFRQAAEIAIKDKAIIPLHFQTRTWAIRNDMGLRFWPASFGQAERTLAQYIIKSP